MLRLRRYRIFMIFAAITLAALYHFTSVRDWEEASAASIKTFHDYGVKHGNEGAPVEVTPLKKEGSQENEEKAYIPAIKTPVAEDDTAVVTRTSTSTTSLNANEPTNDSTTTTQDPTSTNSASATIKATAPTVTPAAIIVADLPIPGLVNQEHIQPQDGHGSYEPPPLLPDKPLIHWTSLPEHFPVPTESLIQLPTGKPLPIPKVQFEFAEETSTQKVEREEKLAVVREAFQHSWKGYKDKAWLQDELSPVSGGHRNPFCGWAATLVDSLDTLWIMGLEEDFTEAALAVGEIDFTTSFRNDIPLFETTIRYLGGLVSAYDISGGKYRVLLDKAVQLAEVLMGAFDTPNRMPITYYFWKPTFASNAHRASVRAVLAELGSLSMEFTRLAQITKETKYYDAIARITNEFEVWQNNTHVPGLWPHQVDASGCRKPDKLGMTPVMHSGLNGPQSELVPPASPLHDPRLPLDIVSAEEAEKAQKAGKTNIDQENKKSDIPKSTAVDLDTKRSSSVEAIDSTAAGSKAAASRNSTLATSQYDEVDSKGRHYKARIENWGGEIDTDEAGKVPIRHLKPPTSEGSSKKEALTKRQLVAADLETGPATAKVPESAKVASSEEAGSLSPLKQTKNDAGEYTPVASAVFEEDFDCKPQGFAPPPRSMAQTYTFGGQADSVYEYLPKQHLLLGGLVPQYQSMYEAAADAGIKHLLFRPMIPGNRDIRVLSKLTTTKNVKEPIRYEHEYGNSHLLCFSGGMYALGSMLFDRKEDMDIAAKLTDGCVWAYESTRTGIMPEGFDLIPCKSMKSCTFNETLWYEKLDPYRSFREQNQKNAQQQVLEQKQNEGVAGAANTLGGTATENEAAVPKAIDHKAGDVEPATNGGANTGAMELKPADVESVSKKTTDTEAAAPDAVDADDKLPTEGPLAKRQLGDIENDPLLGPKSQLPAQSKVEESNKALADKGDAAIPQSPKDKELSSSVAATPTVAQENLYPSHEEYGRSRIDKEGLPIGIPSISSRSYILRLVSFLALSIFSFTNLLAHYLDPKPLNLSSSCIALVVMRYGAKKVGKCSTPFRTTRVSSLGTAPSTT